MIGAIQSSYDRDPCETAAVHGASNCAQGPGYVTSALQSLLAKE